MTRVVTFGEVMLRLKSPGFERLLPVAACSRRRSAAPRRNVAVVARASSASTRASSRRSRRTTSATPCVASCAGSASTRRRSAGRASGSASTSSRTAPNQRPSRSRTIARARRSRPRRPATSTGTRSSTAPTGSTSAASRRRSARRPPSCRSTPRSAARAKGITVSCDYNYRKNLWKYGKKAPEVMRELVAPRRRRHRQRRGLPEGARHRVDVDVKGGELDTSTYRALAERVLDEFPESRAAGHHAAREPQRRSQRLERRACTTASEFLIEPPLRHHGHRRSRRRRRLVRGRSDLRPARDRRRPRALEFATAAVLPQALHPRRLQPVSVRRSRRSCRATPAAASSASAAAAVAAARVRLPLDDLRAALLRDDDQLHRSPGARHSRADAAARLGWNESEYGNIVSWFSVAYGFGLLVAGRLHGSHRHAAGLLRSRS